jgi:hypothetical protein
MRDKIIVVAIKSRSKLIQQRPAITGNAKLKENHRIIKGKRKEKRVTVNGLVELLLWVPLDLRLLEDE